MTRTHKAKISEVLKETKNSIKDKSGGFVNILGEQGIYSNSKPAELNKIDEVLTLLLSCHEGFVIDDDWNETLIFAKKNNVFYLFAWETTA